MFKLELSLFFITAAILSGGLLMLYHLRAFSFCCSIFQLRPTRASGLALSSAAQLSLVALAFLFGLPTPLFDLLLFAVIFLEFLLLFEGRVAAFLFGTCTLMFHFMNVRMAVASVLHLTAASSSPAPPWTGSGTLLRASITLVLSLVFLETYRRLVDSKSLRLLISNVGQLHFLTSSLCFINLYLVLLGSVYNRSSAFAVPALFLLITVFLLFGSFYTAFNHAVKMTILIECRVKAKALESQLRQSTQSIDELRSIAFTDALTHIYNRRYGMQKLNTMLSRPSTFFACFIDLDHLKTVNDTYGHGEGDRYLLLVVRVLSDFFQSDVLCRLGGDEFMILMDGLDRTAAESRMKEAYDAVQQLPQKNALPYTTSFSYGIIEILAQSGMTVSEVLQKADGCMYGFKKSHKFF